MPPVLENTNYTIDLINVQANNNGNFGTIDFYQVCVDPDPANAPNGIVVPFELGNATYNPGDGEDQLGILLEVFDCQTCPALEYCAGTDNFADLPWNAGTETLGPMAISTDPGCDFCFRWPQFTGAASTEYFIRDPNGVDWGPPWGSTQSHGVCGSPSEPPATHERFEGSKVPFANMYIELAGAGNFTPGNYQLFFFGPNPANVTVEVDAADGWTALFQTNVGINFEFNADGAK